jgi:hypothetical protein
MQIDNLMQQELETSLVTEINLAHQQCLACDSDLEELILKKCNCARKCGLNLINAKEKVGHGNWMSWVNSNLGFSLEMAHRYMRFHDAHPELWTELKEGIRSLKDAMIATGALVAASGHGQQTLHQPNFFSFVAKYLTNFKAEWEKQLSRRPLEEWDQPEVEQFVSQLEPVVEDVNGIYATAKARLTIT